MGFIKEFKEFAIKGNVIDLAIGIIIGAAFSRIVNSVINDLIMPLVAGLIGSPDFSNAYLPLKEEVPYGLPLEEAQALGPVFAYGNFITEVLNFLLMAIAVFMIVKAINSMKRKKEVAVEAAPVISSTDKLLMEIRDQLRSK